MVLWPYISVKFINRELSHTWLRPLSLSTPPLPPSPSLLLKGTWGPRWGKTFSLDLAGRTWILGCQSCHWCSGRGRAAGNVPTSHSAGLPGRRRPEGAGPEVIDGVSGACSTGQQKPVGTDRTPTRGCQGEG